MGQLFKNVASQKVRVFAFADAGHASLDAGEPVTGDAANISARVAVDNAALAASNDTAPTEVDATNAPGYYEFDATQAETNGDVVEWYPKSSTAGVQVVTVGGNVQTTQPQYLPDLGIESDGHVHADVKEIEGSDATDQIRDAVVDDATRIDASALNTASGAIGSDGTNLTEAGGTGDHLTAVPDTSGTTTLLSRLTATRAGYLDNLSAGAVATAAALATVDGKLDTIDGIVDQILADTGTDGVALSAATMTAIADAFLDRANGVEAGYTPKQALRLIAAACAGKLSGGATTTNTLRSLDDSADRITATVDADGNRTAVVHNA